MGADGKSLRILDNGENRSGGEKPLRYGGTEADDGANQRAEIGKQETEKRRD
jgi:hypothetical protein